jgi:hypothetical protein
MQVDHEYERQGARAYRAAWDVRRGRGAARTGTAPFGRLVDRLRQPEPYRAAPRVFGVGDPGSRHRGAQAARALAQRYPHLILVHLPPPASWLNPIELYFSLLPRKVRTPDDFAALAAVEERLRAYETLYNQTAGPFAGTVTRAHLEQRLAPLDLAHAA